jgi:putative ABC transport system permease protein
MVVGNSMVAIALVFRDLQSKFELQREEIETKLSLGASPKLASLPLIRASIRTALLPTVDSMKTLGIVQLPGMMTGLILAGANPEEAIKYQLMVAFMLVGSVTISSVLAGFLTYKRFFNALAQIK